MDELDFGADQIRSAAARALGNSPGDDPLVAELTAPGGIPVTVAVGLSERLVPAAADPHAVADGAAAFVWGLLVSAGLPPVERGIPEALPDALELVRRDGRSTVIARHCDLAAVAEVERTVGAVLRRSDDRDQDVLQALLQLFELGLASGLASRYA